MKVIAGIVLYNPQKERLMENINAISSQVESVFCIDNASDNKYEIGQIISRYSNVSVKYNSENKGIAAALNQLLKYAMDNNATYLLTLDQDSVVSDKYVHNILDFNISDNVALIAPNILDRNDKSGVMLENKGIRCVNDCITSGTMMNVQICKKIGWFDEKMFIDYVDFEYCYRVVDKGYKIIKNNNVVLSHQLGDGKIVRLLGTNIMVANHSPIRHFYLIRNLVYLVKKYPMRTVIFMRRIFKEFILIIFYELNKIEKLKACIKGMYKGLFMR